MIESLYVHIPFCLKKCLYCDFNSYTNVNLQDDYIKALEKELLSVEQKKFKTIFIGGGTPTILSVKNLETLFNNLKSFQADEFTVECNPGTLNREKLQLMRAYGVNRLSIGLQAWQDKHLEVLGRIHTQAEFVENYKLATELGFENINIDLMFGIPNQSLQDWKDTLDNVLKLKPKHLSCYGLIVEEGTPYHDFYENGVYEVADEELERDMYYYAIDVLAAHGLHHYEISNFSKVGYECKHNITYWKNKEYIGVGAGAHSFVNQIRYSNTMDAKGYIINVNKGNEAWIENKTVISKEDEISEFMFLGLRMLDGINKAEFKQRFGIDVANFFREELIELKELKLLEENETNIALTGLGVDLSNQVFIRFIK